MMEIRTFRISVLSGLFLLCISSCGTNTPGRNIKTSQLAGGLEYMMLEEGDLKSDGQSVSGTGKLIFKSPRPSEDSNYTFTIRVKDGGKVTLLSNADKNLSAGVSHIFGKAADKPSLVLSVGAESYDLSGDLTGLAFEESLSIEIDVHAHGHTILWVQGQKFEYAFSTRLPGKFWGFELSDATISQVAVGPAKEG
jgi:hypothetical protein